MYLKVSKPICHVSVSHSVVRLSDRAGRDELSVSDLSHSTFGIVDTGAAGSMLGTGIMSGA